MYSAVMRELQLLNSKTYGHVNTNQNINHNSFIQIVYEDSELIFEFRAIEENGLK